MKYYEDDQFYIWPCYAFMVIILLIVIKTITGANQDNRNQKKIAHQKGKNQKDST